MKKINKIALILILSIATAVIANSQCLPPPPIIESVTVEPNATGDIIISWHENPDNHCTTTGYEIYKYNYSTQQFDLLSLEPVGITTFLDVNAGGNSRSQIYRMTTKAGAAGNEHSENHHSVYLHPAINYNLCNFTTLTRWSPYKTSYRDGFEIRPIEQAFNESVRYQIIGYIAPTGSPFNIANATPLTEITADTTISFAMIPNQNYLFCVKIFLPNGEMSYSNVREGIITGVSVPIAPSYIHLDSIVSFDTYNHLHFDIDNSTQMTKFQIERTTHIDSVFEVIHTFSDKITTTFDDHTCDVNKKYFYQLTAFNNISACDTIPAQTSNILNSTILDVKYINPNMEISWTDLFCEDVRYRLYRNGSFWLLQNNTQISDVSIESDLMNNIHDFCYRIVANDQITNNTSISREQCVSLNKKVTMPNAIDPTSTYSNNLETLRRRNQFAPIIGGKDTDYEYYMVIFNRWNNVIFETTKPMDIPLTNEYMWNGASAQGHILPEDTYLYYVKVTFKGTNRVIEQRGNVSIVYH